MNEQIKKLAEQAGFQLSVDYHGNEDCVERFAELVRADEREVCAKLVEKQFSLEISFKSVVKCAEAIRARTA